MKKMFVWCVLFCLFSLAVNAQSEKTSRYEITLTVDFKGKKIVIPLQNLNYSVLNTVNQLNFLAEDYPDSDVNNKLTTPSYKETYYLSGTAKEITGEFIQLLSSKDLYAGTIKVYDKVNRKEVRQLTFKKGQINSMSEYFAEDYETAGNVGISITALDLSIDGVSIKQ